MALRTWISTLNGSRKRGRLEDLPTEVKLKFMALSEDPDNFIVRTGPFELVEKSKDSMWYLEHSDESLQIVRYVQEFYQPDYLSSRCVSNLFSITTLKADIALKDILRQGKSASWNAETFENQTPEEWRELACAMASFSKAASMQHQRSESFFAPDGTNKRSEYSFSLGFDASKEVQGFVEDVNGSVREFELNELRFRSISRAMGFKSVREVLSHMTSSSPSSWDQFRSHAVAHGKLSKSRSTLQISGSGA